MSAFILSMAEAHDGSILAGTTRGLYRSTNNGDRWSMVETPFRNGAIPAIVVAKNGAIVAGGYYPFANNLLPTPLMRSTDNGITWTPSAAPITVVNLISDDFGVLYGNDYLYFVRSSDAGVTWDTASEFANDGNTFAVIAPNLWVTTHEYITSVSRDSGATWATVDWPGHTIAKAGDGTLFRCTLELYGPTRMFRSTDNGETWTSAMNDGDSVGFALMGMDFDGNMLAHTRTSIVRWDADSLGWRHAGSFDVAMRPGHVLSTKTTTFIYGYEGVFRSIGNDGIWIDASSGMTSMFTTALTMSRSGDLLARSLTSTYRSSDLGSTWSRQILPEFGLVHIVESPMGTMLAGTAEGVYRSTNNGASWHVDSLGPGSSYAISLAILSDGTLFALEYAGRIWRSTDDGVTWTQTPRVMLYESRMLGAVDSLLFVAERDTVRVSSDRGMSWTVFTVTPGARLICPLPDGDLILGCNARAFRYRSAARTLTQIPQNDTIVFTDIKRHHGFIYAASDRGGVFRIPESGDAPWESVSGGLHGHRHVGLVSHPSGYLFVGGNGGGVQQSYARASAPASGAEAAIVLTALPQPATSTLWLEFEVDRPTTASMCLRGITGQIVGDVASTTYPAGKHRVAFEVVALPIGVYLAEMNCDSERRSVVVSVVR